MSRSQRALVLAAAATCALFASACSKAEVDSAQNAVASSAPRIADDVGIAARIEGRFAEIDPASALHVAVAVHGGVVRLSGGVRDASVRTRYVAAANGVSDVTRVTSSLAIDPKIPNVRESVGDFALEASVRAKLVEEAGVNGVNVHVLARDGRVTLSGDVPSQSVATTLVESAKGVRGAKDVANALKVAP